LEGRRREGDTHEAGFYNNISYKTTAVKESMVVLQKEWTCSFKVVWFVKS